MGIPKQQKHHSVSRRQFFPAMGTVGVGMTLLPYQLAAQSTSQNALEPSQPFQRTRDIVEINQLVLTERNTRDNQEWGEMRDCYHPDSEVKVSWFHGTGWEFVNATKRLAKKREERGGKLASHWTGAILVRLSGNRAVATVPLVVIFRDAFDGVEFEIDVVTTCYYQAEQREQQWRISGLYTIYERDILIPLIPGEAFPIDKELLASFRPSYRFLSYFWKSKGRDIDQQLPGSDRPDLVEELENNIFSWMR